MLLCNKIGVAYKIINEAAKNRRNKVFRRKETKKRGRETFEVTKKVQFMF